MHRFLQRLMIAWLLPGFLAPAMAQDRRISASPQASQNERQAVQWFNLLDHNGDGQVTRTEARWAFQLDKRLAAQFDQADANHDGIVTEAEIRALAAQRKAERAAHSQTKP